MKNHNVEVMQATYNRNDSDDVRAAQVLELAEAIKEEGDSLETCKRSVRAKLCTIKDNDGVSLYKKAGKVSKTGAPQISKSSIVGGIAGILSVDVKVLESLTNATKATLQALSNGIASAMPEPETNAEDVPTTES